MPKLYRMVSAPLFLLSVWLAPSLVARPQPQQGPATFNVVHVIGLEGVKHNAKGEVIVSREMFQFASGTMKSAVPIPSIQDALTGADSQRLIGGTVGTLSMFAPYESGRFLSLFRTKIDTLTIAYRDHDGGLHGAIFTLPQGQAALLKKEMIAEGVKTTVSDEVDANQPTGSKKPQEKRQ